MADYKFGQNILDLDNYIHNLGSNVSTYLEALNWTPSLKLEFISSYNTFIEALKAEDAVTRLHTDDFGTIHDSQGILTNANTYSKGDATISLEDYDSLKKRKQRKYTPFDANGKVAEYFKRVGDAIVNDQKSKPKKEEEVKTTPFDIRKHGFLTWWVNRASPGNSNPDITPYLEYDKVDPETKKRPLTERMKYLSGLLLEYLKNLPEYDFTNTPFGSLENYQAKLQEAIKLLNDGTYNNSDQIALLEIGIGNNFYDTFFTTDEAILTQELKAALEAQKKSEEEKNLSESKLRAWLEHVDSLITSHKNDFLFNSVLHNIYIKPDEWLDAENNLTTNFLNELNKIRGNHNNWNDYITLFLKNPHYYYDEDNLQVAFNKEEFPYLIQWLINKGHIKPFIDSLGSQKYYFGRTDKFNSVFVYDPIEGTITTKFIGDVPELLKELRYNFEVENGWINPNSKYYKEGGILKGQNGINFEELLDRDIELVNRANAKKQGKTLEEYYQSNYKPFGEPDIINLDSGLGLSGIEALRMASVLSDLTSLGLAFVPGVGNVGSAVTGFVGSTVPTFIADIFEDGLDWGDVLQFGGNTALDLIGIVPGGGLAAKSNKVIKTLAKYTPKLSKLIGTINLGVGVTNADEIISSLNRVTSDPKNLTVLDYLNIAHGLSLILQSSAAGKRLLNQKKANSTNRVSDAVALEFSNGDNKKVVAFTGEDAANIKGKTADEINSYLKSKNYEELDGWTLNSKGNSGFNWKLFSVHDDSGWHRPRRELFGIVEKPKITNQWGVFNIGTADRPIWQASDNGLRVYGLPQDASKYTSRSVNNRNTGTHPLPAGVPEKGMFSTKIGGQDYSFDHAEADKIREYLTRNGGSVEDAANALGFLKRGGVIDFNKIRRFLDGGWFNNLYKLKVLKYKGKDIDVNNTPNSDLRNNMGVSQYLGYGNDRYNISAAYQANEAYKKSGNIASDILNYFLNSGDISELTDLLLVDLYNLDALKIRDFWELNENLEYTRNENILNHNTLHKKMFASRNINKGDANTGNVGWDDDNADWLGTSTWARRMDRYEDEFNGQTDRIHTITIGDRTLKVYKKANGDIGLLTEDPITPVTPVDTATGTPAGDGPQDPTGSLVKVNTEGSGLLNPESTTYKEPYNATWLYGLPRTMYANRVNSRMTNRALAALIPYLLDPRNIHRYTFSDLDAENTGLRSEALLNFLAAQPTTSDGDLQTTARFDAFDKGLNYIRQGLLTSNLTRRLSIEADWALEKENKYFNYDVALKNRASMLGTISNKVDIRNAKDSKEYTNWDTLWRLLEYDYRTKSLELKQRDEALWTSQLDYNLNYTPWNVIKMDDVLKEIYNKALYNGYSSLNDYEKAAYLRLKQQITQARSKELARYYGVNTNGWFTGLSDSTITVNSNKKGGVIAKDGVTVARIKARTADADRFQKSIEATMNRHHKLLENISKRMYDFVKMNKRK